MHTKPKNAYARWVGGVVLAGGVNGFDPNLRDCYECLCFCCAEKGKQEACSCPCYYIAKTVECIFFRSSRKSSAIAYCGRFGISALYHLTNWKNLESILRLGLLSRNLIESRDISHVGFAYETALRTRARKELAANKPPPDYVPLFFHQLPPMLRVLQYKFPVPEIVYVCVSPEILGEDGVYFTDRNYAATDSEKFYDIQDLRRLQWEIIRNPIRARPGTEESNIQGAEVFVPERIDPRWLSKIIVYDGNMKTMLENSLLKTHAISIEARPEFYFLGYGRI